MARLALGSDEVPATVLGALRGRVEGVPLLVEEMLSAYLAAGGRASVGAEWRLSRRVADGLPASYRDLVRGRLATLDDWSRRVVFAGAVLGRTFDWRLLRRIAPGRGRPGPSGASGGNPGAAYPGLPGEWCNHAAALRVQAADRLGASRLLLESARRAFARGALETAESSLLRALELVEGDYMAWLGPAELLVAVWSAAGKTDRLVDLARSLPAFFGRYRTGSRAALVPGRWATRNIQHEVEL
jgi:hypothetical protein